MRGYQQLSVEERIRIEALLEAGLIPGEIARQLGRHPGTISRELRRNSSPGGGYEAAKAQQCKQSRKRGRPPCVVRPESLQEPRGNELWRLVLDGLQRGWSPEIIAGRLRAKRPGSRLCAETIYRFIYAPGQREQQLWRSLVRSHGKRRRNTGTRNQQALCDWGEPLSQRPAGANERSELGHWEIDTMCFSQPGKVIVHLVERRSRFGIALLMPSREADPIGVAVRKRLGRLPAKLVLSLTSDRGTEFARLRTEELKLYLCAPYSAWQKGSIENQNGLLRRYFPRRTEQAGLTQRELNEVRTELNHRPMKVLGYRTPHEVLSFLANQHVALHL